MSKPNDRRNSYAKRRDKEIAETMADKAAAGLRWNVVKMKHVDIDAAELKKSIPNDTRDLTARICGDPIPGRSALDRRAS